MSIEKMLETASDQQIVFLHLGVPIAVFKKLNELAAKEKKTFAWFITETLTKRADELIAKYDSPKQEG